MHTTFKERLAKMSTKDIMDSIQCVNKLGKLTDEELAERGLQIEEPQQINHFLNAINEKQSTLLAEQAITLLRLTPSLLKNGNTTVHRVLLTATPKVLEAYGKAQTTEERVRIGKALRTAGLVCVDRHLKTAGLENRLRLWELNTYRPFVGKEREFYEAEKRFDASHKIYGFSGRNESFGESPNATPFKSRGSYPRGLGGEYD